MTQNIGVLPYQETDDASAPVAVINCNFGIDTFWSISTLGSSSLGPAQAKYCYADNSINSTSAVIQVGPVPYVVNAFTEKVIALPSNVTLVTVSGTEGVVSCTFSPKPVKGTSDDSNALAIQVAAQNVVNNGLLMGLNTVYNPDFEIWSEFTTIIPERNSIGYCAEHWCYNSSNGNITINQVYGISNSKHALSVSRTASASEATTILVSFTHLMEVTSAFAGQTITYSFDTLFGQTFSGTLTAQIVVGTGGIETNVYNFSGAQQIASQIITPGIGTSRNSVSGSIPSNATQVAIVFAWTPSGIAGTADSFTIACVQQDYGSMGTPYRAPDPVLEFHRAEYFYQELVSANNGVSYLSMGFYTQSAAYYFPMKYRSKMRLAPNITISAPNTFAVTNIYQYNSSLTGLSVNNETNVGFIFSAGNTNINPTANSPSLLASGGGAYVKCVARL